MVLLRCLLVHETCGEAPCLHPPTIPEKNHESVRFKIQQTFTINIIIIVRGGVGKWQRQWLQWCPNVLYIRTDKVIYQFFATFYSPTYSQKTICFSRINEGADNLLEMIYTLLVFRHSSNYFISFIYSVQNYPNRLDEVSVHYSLILSFCPFVHHH